jgi:hypothetical protein
MVGCGVLEVYYRFVASSSVEYGLHQSDPELGWAPSPNLSLQLTGTDLSGAKYPVVFKTNSDGFRDWGDENSVKLKVLFVGDSFTYDKISNEQTYFGVLKDLLNVEVFAIAAGGYGTLQELILLKRFIHKVNPGLFVLQFCSNDFNNNSLEIESSQIYRQQIFYRPYQVNGLVKFREGQIYRFMNDNSYFFRNVDRKLQDLQFRYYHGAGPIEDNAALAKKLDAAERITLSLLEQIAAVVPRTTKLATFNCDTAEDDLTARWIRISERSGFDVWPNVSQEVERQETQGRIVRQEDGGHWNPAGHSIAAYELKKQIMPMLE